MVGEYYKLLIRKDKVLILVKHVLLQIVPFLVFGNFVRQDLPSYVLVLALLIKQDLTFRIHFNILQTNKGQHCFFDEFV